jgi:glycosyltransferase involved in cell wall biosynthesis
MRIGIDLTWLKPRKSGGVEFFAKNLIDGFLKLSDQNEYVLLLAKDNSDYLKEHFGNDPRLTYVECETNANAVAQHLWWQSAHEYKVLQQNHLNFCYFPVYEMPIYKNKNIKCVTTIHDIQAQHFPEYFKMHELIWFHMAWQKVLDNSERVIVTSNYTKKDLEKNYKSHGNVQVIYIPVTFNSTKIGDFDDVKTKFQIERGQYFYTVCSMRKHKNLITLLKVIKKISEDNKNLPQKLVISGVGGPDKENFKKQIREMGIQDHIILTAFVSDEERNALIKNSNMFLFPSIFEGFGMPPIEAAMLGAKVLTTKETSLAEVTMNRCNYVENPLSVDEWIAQIQKMQTQEAKVIKFDEFNDINIAQQYLDLFDKVNKE